MTKLTVCSVCNNDWAYLEFQDFLMRRLAYNPDFDRLILDVSPDPQPSRARFPRCTVVKHDLQGARGSCAHGIGLNRLMGCIANCSSEHVLVIDPDATAVAPGWDAICAQDIDGKCKAIGAPYDPAIGSRYQMFPNAVFFYTSRAALLSVNPDWTAGSNFWRALWPRLPKFLGCGCGYDQDVGWRIPVGYVRRRYGAKVFDYFKCITPGSQVLAPDSRGDEYQWCGRPIATHQGRSASRRFYADPVSAQWIRHVCDYTKNDYAIPSRIAEMY